MSWLCCGKSRFWWQVYVEHRIRSGLFTVVYYEGAGVYLVL